MAVVDSGVVALADGKNISCRLKSLEVSGEKDIHDATVLCSTAKTFVPGITARSVSGEGLWSTDTVTDAFGVDYYFHTQLTTGPMLFSLGEDGDDVGDTAFLVRTQEAEFKTGAIKPGDLLLFTFSAKANPTAGTNDEWQRGIWLFSRASAITGVTNGTSYDSTSGGTGWLAHIHVVAGDGNATVQIQHSTNNSVWADLYNNPIGPDNAAAPYSTTDPVNRYIRARVTPVATTCTVGVSFKLGYSG